MADTKTTEEKLSELDKKIEQIKAQKKALMQREKEKERKERTHRLIEVGAIVESVVGRPIQKNELESLKTVLYRYENEIINYLNNNRPAN